MDYMPKPICKVRRQSAYDILEGRDSLTGQGVFVSTGTMQDEWLIVREKSVAVRLAATARVGLTFGHYIKGNILSCFGVRIT